MKKYISWVEVEKFIDEVVDTYKDQEITGVYGLPRGGLVFAVMLSHRMSIPMLASPIKGCILVDDICDSGESLIHYFNNTSGEDHEKNYTIVTMYYKPNALEVVPDFWKREKQDDWIVFPWEAKSPERGLLG